MLLHPLNIRTQTIDNELVQENKIGLQVLRLDEIHPVISGNKLFKLHYFLDGYKQGDHKKVVTFGGAYSNHLVATAYACKLKGIACTGIVRGETPAILSHTLQQCMEYGMQLQFTSREMYSKKETAGEVRLLTEKHGNCIIIPEGGFDRLGATGAAAIGNFIAQDITHICCAAGTATTASGLLLSAKPQQQVIVFPALKGLNDIEKRLVFLTRGQYNKKQVYIADGYHFGGYAKKTTELIHFMNTLFDEQQLPTDFVYTGKMMYGVMDLVQKKIFPAGSKVLCIHTGGLQGNLSLAPGTLTF